MVLNMPVSLSNTNIKAKLRFVNDAAVENTVLTVKIFIAYSWILSVEVQFHSCRETMRLLPTVSAVSEAMTASIAFQCSWFHYCKHCTLFRASTAATAVGTSQSAANCIL
jgi:hypothetical protein